MGRVQRPHHSDKADTYQTTASPHVEARSNQRRGRGQRVPLNTPEAAMGMIAWRQEALVLRKQLLDAGLSLEPFEGFVRAIATASEQPSTYFSILAEQTGELTLVLDADGMVRAASPAWSALAGIGDNTAPVYLQDLVHADDAPSVSEVIALAVAAAGAMITIQFRTRTAEGSWHRVEGTVRSMLSHPSISGVVLAVQDMTTLENAEARRAYERLHDTLTSLPNRTLFLDRLVHVLHRSSRPGDRLFAVLVVDVDRFKAINDSFGHTAGDQFLVAIAQRLSACLRSGDTAARLGDDEFGVLLEDLDDWHSARRIADRIQEELATTFVYAGHEIFISASIGITLGIPSYEQADDLLRDATIAMFRAKVLGRARYEVFDPAMHARATAQLRLEAELRRALDRHELRVFYQPIVSLTTGSIIGVEALARWEHPERGLIPPAQFIPTAEETGLIVPIGEWVLRSACKQAMLWEQDGFGDLQVAVNLSARQFRRRDIATFVAQVLKETGLQPQRLELELTESSVMEDAESAIQTLQELQALGVRLALDDFGTGYSSLSYLKRFPLSSLKIDGSFVQDLNTNVNDATIVTAIIAMTHHLNLQVVAEHVDNAAQLDFLRSYQCDAYQGYFCSPPLPSDELTDLLVRKHGVA